MRVVLLARLFYSGQTTHTVELARELARQGHTVALLSHGPCHLAAWTHACRTLEREGVACHRHARPGEALAAAVQLDPQILHVHSSDLLPLAAQVAAETGAPVIFTAHGLGTLRQPLVKRPIASSPSVPGCIKSFAPEASSGWPWWATGWTRTGSGRGKRGARSRWPSWAGWTRPSAVGSTNSSRR